MCVLAVQQLCSLLQDLQWRLLTACTEDPPDALRALLSSQPLLDLNSPLQTSQLPQPMLPLALAAVGHAPSCCQVLVSAGAEVNATDELGSLCGLCIAIRMSCQQLPLPPPQVAQRCTGQCWLAALPW